MFMNIIDIIVNSLLNLRKRLYSTDIRYIYRHYSLSRPAHEIGRYTVQFTVSGSLPGNAPLTMLDVQNDNYYIELPADISAGQGRQSLHKQLTTTLSTSRPFLIIPYLFVFVSGVLWGGTFSLALIATADGAHPLALTTWQVFLTAIMTSFICIMQKQPPFQWKNLSVYIVIAGLGVIVPDIVYYYAAPHLSAGILSITISTVPVFTYLAMWGFGFERLVIKRALGILLGMAAILLLVIPDQGLGDPGISVWVLWVLVCAVCYSLENVYFSESVGEKVNIFEILSGSTIVASVILIPANYLTGVAEPVSWIFSSSGWAITAIAAVSTVAYGMFFYTIRVAGPVFASQCAYVVTISGVIWGIILFAEGHSIWVWSSVAVMLTGVALVSPEDKESVA